MRLRKFEARFQLVDSQMQGQEWNQEAQIPTADKDVRNKNGIPIERRINNAVVSIELGMMCVSESKY
jgi:hypothetical protein